MSKSLKRGSGFGLTSAVITTLGMIVGLNSATHSRLAVIGGIIMIAIADSLSDGLGMHISEEFSRRKNKEKEIWRVMGFTILFKFIFAANFVIPFLILDLYNAIIISLVWGGLLISVFSFYLGRENKVNPLKVIAEHLIIASLVIVITYYLGILVGNVFV